MTRRRKFLKEIQSGTYFLTMCTPNKKNLFGQIINGKICLNELGEMVRKCWLTLPQSYSNLVLDEFVIMPNHIHGIMMVLNSGISLDSEVIPSSLNLIVNLFKMSTNKAYNSPIWSNNHSQRLVRNETELQALREYIFNNPLQWDLDLHNTAREIVL